MSEVISELRQQVAVVEERMNSMKSENKSVKAENESALGRLRTDMAGMEKRFVLLVVGMGIAIVTVLSALDVVGDRGRQPAPAPVIINMPPGAQMPVVQGREVQVLPSPAPPSAAPLGQPGETAGK